MNKQTSPLSSMLTQHFGAVLTRPVLLVLTLAMTLGIGHIAMAEKAYLVANNACQCSETTNYNELLPSSHPNNRCASLDTDVSWKNWLTGNSRSSQFHFLDLLELLHGHKSQPTDNATPI